jgi:hypothetical protein
MSDREHQRVTGTMWAGRRGESAAGKAKTGVTSSAEDQEAVDLAADWADISQGLRKDLGQQLFNQWIRPIQLGGFCKETARWISICPRNSPPTGWPIALPIA